MAAKYKLKIKRLDLISATGSPAQADAATVCMIKRAGDENVALTARVVKADGPLVWCWAFKSQVDGEPFADLQGDVVDPGDDMIAAAREFMLRGGPMDVEHDGQPDGSRVVFCMPMTPEIGKAYGIETADAGLMIAFQASDEMLAGFREGKYVGVSIAGVGVREPVTKADAEAVRLQRAEAARREEILQYMARQAAASEKLLLDVQDEPIAKSSNGQPRRRTRDDVYNRMTEIAELTARERGLKKSAAVLWLLGDEGRQVSAGREYAMLYTAYSQIASAEQMAVPGYGNGQVDVPTITKTAGHTAAETKYDKLIADTMRAAKCDRTTAVMLVVGTASGSQALDDLARHEREFAKQLAKQLSGARVAKAEPAYAPTLPLDGRRCELEARWLALVERTMRDQGLALGAAVLAARRSAEGKRIIADLGEVPALSFGGVDELPTSQASVERIKP